jgi:hypothetical protein
MPMLKQLLIYANVDLYEHGKLELCHQRPWFDKVQITAEADAMYYVDQYKAKFAKKALSELHIVILGFDPANGITEVTLNEYASNPVKTKTIINAVAKTAPKKKSLAQILATTEVGPFSPDEEDVDPDEEHDHD